MKGKEQTNKQISKTEEMIKSIGKADESGIKKSRSGKALPAKDNFYRSVFENISNAAIIIEEDNTIRLVNKEFEKLTGYKKKEVEGKKKWTQMVVRKEDLKRIDYYQYLSRIDTQSAPRSYGFSFINNQKELKDIVVNVMPINGTRLILAILRDVTERKRMGLAFFESKRRLADIIDFLPDATYAIDLSGKVIAWNRAIEEMSGIMAEDMLEKSNYEYALPFYGIRRPILIDLVFGISEESENKYNFIRREGKVLLAETSTTVRGALRALWGKAGPLCDGGGNVIGAIESIRDVTELKQTKESLQKAYEELELKIQERTIELIQANRALEEEIAERKYTEKNLKESEEKYNQFFKTSMDCAFMTSNDGFWIDLNEAAVGLFGYSSREELMLVRIPDLYATPDERKKHINFIAQHGYTKEFPVDLRKKDGSIMHTIITSMARYDAEGNPIGFQGTIRDITERKRVEEEREKLIQELQEAISNVKTLSGLLPICASCKKIRDDKGYWTQIEAYIKNHSEADFSHSICPECAKRLYPEFFE